MGLQANHLRPKESSSALQNEEYGEHLSHPRTNFPSVSQYEYSDVEQEAYKMIL